jgi:pSer/pThr/pTyr-binding forkhead associated (FHA) protein
MPDDHYDSTGPLWVDGDMTLSVRGQGRDTDRIVKIGRPFALVGQSPDSDICLDDPGVSARHAYLHLDTRGLYVVDLLTRAGTRIEQTGQGVGWVYPGQSFTIAGRQIRLLRMRIDGEDRAPEPTDDDLLAEANQAALLGVRLELQAETDPPWELGSELVFLGWSSACGIQVKDPCAAKVHCAIVRTREHAFLLDLHGQHVTLDDEPVASVVTLYEGALLTIGSTSFTVRVPAPEEHLPALRAPTPAVLVPQYIEPTALVPAELPDALLAWLMGTVQGQHTEILRQQGAFQVALTQLLQQMQQDNAALLRAHLERMENIDRELAALRQELQGRPDVPTDAALPKPSPAPPSPPQATPLRIKRTVPEPHPQASTTWLLERVGQLENENRSAWRDLLHRMTPPGRTEPAGGAATP